MEKRSISLGSYPKDHQFKSGFRPQIMKTEKVSLRKLDWPDLITYFTLLPTKGENFSSKDLVDYFRYKYISETNLGRWCPPDYLRQTASAKKILALYGKELSIGLIDIMFEKHKEIFGKEFNQIIWSLGVLSSEKTGWLVEKIFIEYEKKNSIEKNYEILRLLERPRSEWNFEEREKYSQYLQKQGAEQNGQTQKS